MSHVTGTVQTVLPVLTIGPDVGLLTHNFSHTPAPDGTKLLILHFRNASFPANNRLEVDLGYGPGEMDVFTAASGAEFWTRPINIHALPGGLVPIRYITDGAATGSVQLDRYGRGERHEEDPELSGNPNFQSFSNCDPFLPGSSYTEPDFAPNWFCHNPPLWENVLCVPSAADVRRSVARRVGMIVTVHGEHVSTCSATLIGADLIITAGHCMDDPSTPAELAATSSVTFDYQVNCDGAKPAGYNARFHKIIKVVKFRDEYVGPNRHDYCILQIQTPPGGLGLPPILMREDLPAIGEQIFGIHHPNGAVKKVSIPHPSFATVTSRSAGAIRCDLDVSGGSSGSGLFDTAGRIVGVLSNGGACSLAYFPTATILDEIGAPTEPPITRDVMIVFDRSGSMSLNAGTGTGATKIQEARDAASLFVQLVRAETGNRVGLVSFSTTASTPVDFGIAPVNAANKLTLIGAAPFSGGIVGGLDADGFTTIGGGLEAARLQFPAPGANPRAILLLTDGLQNRPPMIETVEPSLASIDVNAIGFGEESSLDGALLTRLAESHNGLYMRAGDGLNLRKFFALAFGNIFEAGALMDPEFFLPEDQDVAEPVPFQVCGEERITVVIGWDRADALLLVRLNSPSGTTITGGSPGVEQSVGRTWTFLRVPLPINGERDGTWQIEVFRGGGGGEFPPPAVDVRYFVQVLASGGPRLVRVPQIRRFYTGDAINPLVALKYPDSTFPPNATVQVTVAKPDAAIGNILTQSGLRAPVMLDGDIIPARQATLQALEVEQGGPVVNLVEETFDLFDDPAHDDGAFERDGIFGNPLLDLFSVEGNYTFHFKASFGEDCTTTREVISTLYVDVGIDPGNTIVKTDPAGTGPDGCVLVRATLTPRDRYGNFLGPGRLGEFEVAEQPGSSVVSGVHDNGDGSYSVDLCWDPESSTPPGVIITQPDRPPVGVPLPVPEGFEQFVYSVKFLCGVQAEDACHCGPARPGIYATEINIHNYLDVEVKIEKHVLPVVFAGAIAGREPRFVERKASDRLILPPHTAMMDDCCQLTELLLGASTRSTLPLTTGFLEIISNRPLNISAVYTVNDLKSGRVSMDVEQIQGRRVR